MLVASWNVNSIAARLPRLAEWLGERQPDVACLQETKSQDAQFPHEAVHALGYRAHAVGQKSYNGVAVLTRLEAPPWTLVHASLPELYREPSVAGEPETLDIEARFVAVQHGDTTIASVYVPNGRELEVPHYHYKLAFYRALVRFAQPYIDADKKLLLCGDFNVAPRPIDCDRPKHWAKGVMHHQSMRDAFFALENIGMVDTLPQHRTDPGLYSWWDYRGLSFVKNNGLRIDMVMASPSLARASVAAGIDRDMRKGERPSDHVPVWTTFDV